MKPSPSSVLAGPVLLARGADARCCRLSALTVVADVPGTAAEGGVLQPMGGEPVTARLLGTEVGHRFLVHDFELPLAADAHYLFDGERHDVVTRFDAPLRLAYVSCNGLEHGDLDRPAEERNLMWARLRDEHAARPFALLLQGGDQLYADEASGAHPTLREWADAPLDERYRHDFDEAAERAAMRFFVERYLHLYTRPELVAVLASVPSVMMWDDHDIFDGWGSHPAELLDSPVGRGLFDVARRAFLLLQRGLSPSDSEPGDSLSFALRFPGFDLLVPDLRSERRPEQVLGAKGRAEMERQLDDSAGVEHVFLMSSVPLLGPRLSLLERMIGVVPKIRRYEDDLRDQWQSRAHRAEWRWMLERLDALADSGTEVSVLSGEIHLASRGEMPLSSGATLHQLIASGIAHPAPSSWWARALGALARLGEDPLPGRRVTLHPLPGQRGIYVAERNYLVLSRAAGGDWSATWECEDSGRSPALALSADGAAGRSAASSRTALASGRGR